MSTFRRIDFQVEAQQPLELFDGHAYRIPKKEGCYDPEEVKGSLRDFEESLVALCDNWSEEDDDFD